MKDIKFQEQVKTDISLDVQDITGEEETPNGQWVGMEEFRRAVAVMVTEKGPGTDPGDVTLQLRQAKDEDGDGAKDLGDEVKINLETDEAGLLIAEALADELDHANDFKYVGVQVESDETCEAGVVIHRFMGRFKDGDYDEASKVDLS